MRYEDVMVELMLAALEKDGGFTLSARDGQPVKQGYSVGLGRAGSVCIQVAMRNGEDTVRAALVQALRENEGLDYKAALFPVAIGGWVDGQGIAHLEPAMVLRSREQAIAFGRHFGEEAIYDLGAGETITLGGR